MLNVSSEHSFKTIKKVQELNFILLNFIKFKLEIKKCSRCLKTEPEILNKFCLFLFLPSSQGIRLAPVRSL